MEINKENKLKRLKRGRSFHLKIQNDWKRKAEGEIKVEKICVKPSGRKGRIDIHAQNREEKKLVACGEVKASDWDRMTEKALLRNVRRQISQVWDYIESELERGKEVSPGIIFPKSPKNKERMILIEKLFEEAGIPVVWDDETIEERKNR
ncbi:MAG: hypothetical protein AB1410_03825 [Acidobacteriota bacterium]